MTFVLGRPDAEYVDLGRIEHDVHGEALRFREISYCEVRSGEFPVMANSGELPPEFLRSMGLQAILDEMLRAPEIARLEAEIFEPLVRANPVLSGVLEIVSAFVGEPVGSSLRERVYHDWKDERRDSRIRAEVIPIKLNTFELARYPRAETLDRGEYFNSHSAGPIQLTFWVMPSSDCRSLTRISAMPQYSWWRSAEWSDPQGEIAFVPDLHSTHRRYFAAQDWQRTREVLRNWGDLAAQLASKLGGEGVAFEDATSIGSHLYQTPENEPAPPVEQRPATVEVNETVEDGQAEQRARSEPPVQCSGSVLPCSTPVVAFGEWASARVATLGLNPSLAEFVDRFGLELDGDNRRLETRSSLGTARLDELSDPQVRRLLESCRGYFHRQPYRRWFDVLEQVLEPLGASYYDGSACHLDLSPWATDPVWARLTPATRQELLRDGTPFLLEQLRRGFIHVLLLNGSGVVSAFEAATGAELNLRGHDLVEGPLRSRFWAGWFGGIGVIGWSVNLQSSFGVTSTFRAALAERVRQIEGDFFT